MQRDGRERAPDLMTEHEVADYLRVAPATVRYWVETRQIDAYLINGRTLRFK